MKQSTAISTSPDVITLGEALVVFAACEAGALDRVFQFSKHAAGAETNVATGLARMGLHAAWASLLGDDSLGQYLLFHMQSQGIDCTHVDVMAGGKSAFMFKTRQDDGADPITEYHRRGSAASQFSAENLDIPWLTSARHLHVSGVFPALSDSTLSATRQAMINMRKAGRTISFDPNLRPTLWATEARMCSVIEELASLADWVMPGIDEARLLTGLNTASDISAHYLDRGAQRVFIKSGATGAWFQQQGMSEPVHMPAQPVEQVIDTVGAGDAFAVGVISALLEGKDCAAAVRRGQWMGARAIQVRGDSDGLPTREQWQKANVD